jgi:hypothetical protein
MTTPPLIRPAASAPRIRPQVRAPLWCAFAWTGRSTWNAPTKTAFRIENCATIDQSQARERKAFQPLGELVDDVRCPLADDLREAQHRRERRCGAKARRVDRDCPARPCRSHERAAERRAEDVGGIQRRA